MFVLQSLQEWEKPGFHIGSRGRKMRSTVLLTLSHLKIFPSKFNYCEAKKREVPSELTTFFRSDFVRFCENKSKRFGHGKSPETLNFRAFCVVSKSRLTLAEFPYLLQNCQALPKTPEKTEMVLRFPLGFA